MADVWSLPARPYAINQAPGGERKGEKQWGEEEGCEYLSPHCTQTAGPLASGSVTDRQVSVALTCDPTPHPPSHAQHKAELYTQESWLSMRVSKPAWLRIVLLCALGGGSVKGTQGHLDLGFSWALVKEDGAQGWRVPGA